MAELSEKVGGAAHRVSVQVGFTRNLGNFESLRLDVGLELDGVGNPDKTFEKAYGWAEKKLMEAVSAADEALKDN